MELIPPLQDNPESHNIRVRDTLLVVFSAIYYIHLVISCLYTSMLIILEDRILYKFTLSLLLIFFYGFMIVWLLLFNLTCVVKVYLFRLLKEIYGLFGVIV